MTDEREIDLSELWVLATRQFALGGYSLHGPSHWQRVEANALEIAPHSGADVLLLRLFAVLHDSCRENDGHDPFHGARAAAWARQLRNDDRFVVTYAQLSVLEQALMDHDKGNISSDPTIGTCWDADRLDLPRVGITPAARLMSTAHGKHLASIGARRR